METNPEFIVPWKDYHGVETFFIVVAPDGWHYGIYPSEREAIAAAAEAAEPESTDDPACASFSLTVT
jgi:hypothetical protein